MEILTSPCKDCKERHSGCHDRCDKYQAFRKSRLEYYDRHLKEVKEDSAFYESAYKIHQRAFKYHGGKKI